MTTDQLVEAMEKVKNGADPQETALTLVDATKKKVYIEVDGDDLQVSHQGFVSLVDVITILQLSAGAITQQVAVNAHKMQAGAGIIRPPFVPPARKPGQN